MNLQSRNPAINNSNHWLDYVKGEDLLPKPHLSAIFKEVVLEQRLSDNIKRINLDKRTEPSKVVKDLTKTNTPI